MESIQTSASSGQTVAVGTTCARPERIESLISVA
jgi:hypothetical protein